MIIIITFKTIHFFMLLPENWSAKDYQLYKLLKKRKPKNFVKMSIISDKVNSLVICWKNANNPTEWKSWEKYEKK